MSGKKVSQKKKFQYTNSKNKTISIINNDKKDIQKILISSENGFKIWKKTSYLERSKIINKIGKLILKNIRILAKKEASDTGKPFQQCISEVKYCADLWQHASRTIKNVKEQVIKVNKKTNCRIYFEPVGITAIIIPWNSPQLVLSERLPYILAAGCVGIIKPSEFANDGLIKLIEIINNINLPKGVVNLVTGNHFTANLLTNHTKVNAISFTGSSDTGKKVMRSASKDIKRISLELGGKNPFIIFGDANLNLAIKNLIISFTLNSGQACVGTSRVYVEKKILNKFFSKFKKYLNKNKNKNYKLSNYKNYNNAFNYLKKRDFNKNNIFYGNIPKSKNKDLILNPLILTNLKENDDIFKRDLFSPIITIETFDNEEILKDKLNKSKYGLSCVVWTKNIKKGEKIFKRGSIW